MFDFDSMKDITPERAEELKRKWSWVRTDDPQFNYALDSIINTRNNLVIMGPGGVGKSILLKMAADILGSQTVVLSSTGISAANLAGDGIASSTIHSFFQLRPVSIYTTPSIHAYLIDVMCAVKTILIDEISMVNASLMENIMHMLSLYNRLGDMPRLILFGDILQLPPVIRSEPEIISYYRKNFGGGYMFFNSPRFNDGLFEVIHLNTIYRQKEGSWQNVLNRVRMGQTTSEDIDVINSRVTDERAFIRDHELMMYLTPTNRSVDVINDFYYGGMDNERVYHGHYTGKFKPEDNPNLSEEVGICPGMQVMCLMNNSQRGYQNGTMGRVISCEPDSVIIEDKDGNRISVGYEKWEQYEYIVNETTGVIEPAVVGTFTQIGCKPAFACTVHKSQGLTLGSLYANLKGCFSDGLVYVALSRCTSLEGIGLKNPIKKSYIKTSKEALRFLESDIRNTGFDFLIGGI